MADNVISYKRSKETVTKSKLLISLYFGSRPQKSPKITKEKNRSLNCDLLKKNLGFVFLGWYLVNPHVQADQNMCGKGG